MASGATIDDGADPGILPGRPFRGRLRGLPFRYAPRGERHEEVVSVTLGRSAEGDERVLIVPVPTFVEALAETGRPVPLAAAGTIARWHDRDRVPRSRISRWRRSRGANPPASLRGLWSESLPGEAPAAFLERYAPAGRPPSAAMVRRIIDSDWAIPDHDTLRAVLSLPLDWFPVTRGERDDLACIAHCAAPVAALLGHHDFLLPSRGRFGDFARIVRGRLGIAEEADAGPWPRPGDIDRAALRDRLAQSCQGTADMLSAFSDQIALPILLRHGLGGGAQPGFEHGAADIAAARVLAGDKGLLALIDLSDRWHARVHAIDAVLDPLGARGGTWEVPFDRADLGDGIEAVALPTVADLRAEGAPIPAGGLGHCVASYAPACAGYRCVIASIRRTGPDGGIVRLSTVELVRDRDGYRVAQHRGAHNDEPPPEATAALPRLLERLADPGSRSVVGYLEKRRRALAEAAPRETGALANAPAYWRDGASVDRVHAAWRPLLPRPLRDRAALDAAILSASARSDATWRVREGRFYAPAAFGLLAQGYRPWRGPERDVAWPSRGMALLVAPLFAHDRIESILRLAAWRLGRPSSEERWGRTGRLLARGAASALVLALLARCVGHALVLPIPGWTTLDALSLMVPIARDFAVGYLALCLPAHLLLLAGRLARPRGFLARASSPPSSGAYLASRQQPSGREADGGRDASRLVPQDG